jgi:hypothetical protein
MKQPIVIVYKGGKGSGFKNHLSKPGHYGGSLPRGEMQEQKSERFIVPKEAWYIDESRPNCKRVYVQAWVDSLSERGWDVRDIIEKSLHAGVLPQAYSREYVPDWGEVTEKEYTVWRAGKLDKKDEGIYFGPDMEEIRMYSTNNGADIKSYTIKLHNPKTYLDKNEAMLDLFPNCVSEAKIEKKRREYGYDWNATVKLMPHLWEIQDAGYRGADVVKVNRQLDARIAKALNKRGYDSMVLLKPEPPCSREIMLIDPIKNLVQND